jgi:hypothetical protein
MRCSAALSFEELLLAVADTAKFDVEAYWNET